MSLNATPSSERTRIGFFGKRNAGKSSLVNAITNQQVSIVSDLKGTTTDPVKKAMEILPLGPVLIIDTPGTDDEGELGKARVKRAKNELDICDIALLVVDINEGLGDEDRALLDTFAKKGLPHIIVYNKADIAGNTPGEAATGPAGKADLSNEKASSNEVLPGGAGNVSGGADSRKRDVIPNIIVSAHTGLNIDSLKELIASLLGTVKKESFIVADLLSKGDIITLVIPIDESAPKGRLILPQQMVMRELLDTGFSFMTVTPKGLRQALCDLKKSPDLVITDSQAFKQVADTIGEELPLTSFSILMARYRGDLEPLIRGVSRLNSLKDGDRVLISEACTHHRQCNDIGSVKIPGLIKAKLGVEPHFSFSSGGTFPEDIRDYELVIHCGGCMINEKEMKNRIKRAVDMGVPIVNYGMAIASLNGILNRSLEPIL